MQHICDAFHVFERRHFNPHDDFKLESFLRLDSSIPSDLAIITAQCNYVRKVDLSLPCKLKVLANDECASPAAHKVVGYNGGSQHQQYKKGDDWIRGDTDSFELPDPTKRQHYGYWACIDVVAQKMASKMTNGIADLSADQRRAAKEEVTKLAEDFNYCVEKQSLCRVRSAFTLKYPDAEGVLYTANQLWDDLEKERGRPWLDEECRSLFRDIFNRFRIGGSRRHDFLFMLYCFARTNLYKVCFVCNIGTLYILCDSTCSVNRC